MNEKFLKVIIETPKFSFVKYKDDGSVDYISPLPCPFNYGSVPDTVGGDGDRLDAIVLGKRLKGGSCKNFPVIGVVKFTDKGENDKKFICSESKMTFLDRTTILAFFGFYGFAKRLLNLIRGKKGITRFEGIEVYSWIGALKNQNQSSGEEGK